MSLYTQPVYGQQPHYGSMGYGQGPSYQYPTALPTAPYPVQPMDPNGFRQILNTRLSELTVNSRPLIISLSQLAQEYPRWSNIFATSLETHIRRVPPWTKLPAFYVLDAVAKNVYEPYARTFAAFIIPLFLDSYGQVDQSMRSKMEEMLLTWRTGGPGNKELFGIGAQVSMERGIWGNVEQPQASTSYGSTSAGHISQAQVLSELEFTLNAKHRAIQTNPYDNQSRDHANVLSQLRSLVANGSVSQNDLREILEQLRSMQTTSLPPAPPPAPASTPQHYQAPVAPQPPAYGAPSPPAQAVATGQVLRVAPQVATIPTVPQPVANASAPLTNLASLVDATKLQNLFNSLAKAGVVSSSNNGTPLGAGMSSQAVVPALQEVDTKRQAARNYRSTLLSYKIKLNSTDITRQRPALVQLSYNRHAAQCKQCGLRFVDDDAGKKVLEEHLDMHFRQNRKTSQDAGRGHSRSWFVSIEDWLRDHPVVAKGKGRADNSRRLTVKEAAAADVAKRDAELRAMHVVVPPGDEARPIKCPICKEHMPTEFVEEEEEWVWRNAVRKEDKIYHATCHAEAATTAPTLATRLRNGTTSRSRSGTPERSSMRATPVKTDSPTSETKTGGLKRKAEDDEVIGTQFDGDRTPPAKKLALAS